MPRAVFVQALREFKIVAICWFIVLNFFTTEFTKVSTEFTMPLIGAPKSTPSHEAKNTAKHATDMQRGAAMQHWHNDKGVYFCSLTKTIRTFVFLLLHGLWLTTLS